MASPQSDFVRFVSTETALQRLALHSPHPSLMGVNLLSVFADDLVCVIYINMLQFYTWFDKDHNPKAT